MLLSSWDDLPTEMQAKIESNGSEWAVQPKLDGIRAILQVTEKGVVITSRNVSEVNYRLSEFQCNLPHLVKAFTRFRGLILDGELLCPIADLQTQKTVSGSHLQATQAILSTTPEQAQAWQDQQQAWVNFHAFDILQDGSENLRELPWIARQERLAHISECVSSLAINAVPHYLVNKAQIHKRYIERGCEGTVWKKIDSVYEQGIRSRNWLKRKRSLTVEGIATNFIMGSNKFSGLVGAVEFSELQADGSMKAIGWVSQFTDMDRLALTNRLLTFCPLVDVRELGIKALIVGQDLSAKSKRLRHARLSRWVQF